MFEEMKMPDLDAMRQDIKDVKVMQNILKGMLLTELDEIRMQDEIAQAAARFMEDRERSVLQDTDAEALYSMPYTLSEEDRDACKWKSIWDILQDKKLACRPCGMVAKVYTAKVREKISVAMIMTADEADAAPLCMALYKYQWINCLMPLVRDYYEELDVISEIVEETKIPSSRLAWTFSSLRAKKELAEADRLLLKVESDVTPTQLELLAKRHADAMNPDPCKAIAYVRENIEENFELLQRLGYEIGEADPFHKTVYDMAG